MPISSTPQHANAKEQAKSEEDRNRSRDNDPLFQSSMTAPGAGTPDNFADDGSTGGPTSAQNGPGSLEEATPQLPEDSSTRK